jgi:hypothetical protein
MNKIFVLALVGAVITILVSLFDIYVGLALSNVLKSFGIYVRDGTYSFAQLHPDIARFETTLNLAYGSVGLFAGIIGIIGGKISKFKGGILLVIAGAVSFIAIGLIGIIPFILLLTSGILAFREKPAEMQTVAKQIS